MFFCGYSFSKMNYQGKRWRTIWRHDADTAGSIGVIDQRLLPHEFRTLTLRTMEDCAEAIRNMTVRGAPLIGATAAYGICFALRDDPGDAGLAAAYATLHQTRPTAINLKWALDQMQAAVAPLPPGKRLAAAYARAAELCDEDVAVCEAIGRHGLEIFREILAKKPTNSKLNVLTHCNAGWLACVDWGTALAPIFMAHDAGLPVHVWVDETRPRNQGASLTAWELNQHGVPHTVVVDNAGGHLMQHGLVDLVIVGTDRTTAQGGRRQQDRHLPQGARRAGTTASPFTSRCPVPPSTGRLRMASAKFRSRKGARRRSPICAAKRRTARWRKSRSRPTARPPCNYGFDVTPARLVTAFITEKGVCPASAAGLRKLFNGSGGL